MSVFRPKQQPQEKQGTHGVGEDEVLLAVLVVAEIDESVVAEAGEIVLRRRGRRKEGGGQAEAAARGQRCSTTDIARTLVAALDTEKACDYGQIKKQCGCK
jgi:hypothetical protein